MNKPAKRILYVEDDLVTLMAYRNRLEREGFTVEPAHDGLEAIKCLSRFVPDLVLLDLMLPRINGEELLKYIRATDRLKHVPVIVLSTNSIIDGEHEHLLESASKRLIKDTCTFAVMLQAIREALGEVPVAEGIFSRGKMDSFFSSEIPDDIAWLTQPLLPK